MPPPVSATIRLAVFKRCVTASGNVSGIAILLLGFAGPKHEAEEIKASEPARKTAVRIMNMLPIGCAG